MRRSVAAVAGICFLVVGSGVAQAQPDADLAITKTDGVVSVVPGASTTYTIIVSNAGPSDVTGATVGDLVPAGLAAATWLSIGSSGGGSVTGPSSGTGDLATTVDLPVGATVTFSVTAQVDPAATGVLSNTATVTPPAGVTDPNSANDSATDTDALTPEADLSITKTDGVASVAPGTLTTYTITASNAGPSDAPGATVVDTFPSAVALATWTCAGVGGGTCTTGSGVGNIDDAVNLPVGGSVTFTVTAQIASSATGTLSNTATVTPPAGVTDPNSANDSATDTDALTPEADLSITNTDGVASVVPGASTTYTIVVSNSGPSTAVAQQVTDLLPAAITSVSWTAVASPGSSVAQTSGNGDILTTVTLLPGGSATFTAVAQISPSATGSLSNTATVAVPPGDNTPADNSATDTDSLSPLVVLAITKDDGKTTAVPGTTTTYTIVVSNAGPADVTGATLTDPVPAGITGATWVFIGATGGGTVTGPSSGSGDLATTVNVPVGATVTFSSTVQINPSATGSLTNTATVAPPGGTPVSASDTDTLTPEADLSVSKTDGKTSALPGTSTTYTITAANAGPSTVSSIVLTDALPSALLNPVFGTPSAGSYDPATGVWSGLSLASGQSVTITLTGTIDPAATGSLTNTATVSPPAGVSDPNSGNNSATDADTLTPDADLAITKTDGVTSATPGGSTTYTITASNAGPSDAPGATVADTFGAAVGSASWTCAGAGGGTCTASGSGNINDTVNLPAGGSATYTVTVQIASSATGTLSNTATVTPPIGVTDPNPANDSATDTDTLTPAQVPPSITSPADATFTIGRAGSFTVTATGHPTSSLSESGALPGGTTFKDNGNGTASLFGTPAADTGGIYHLTITASNGVSPQATQGFTLTVQAPPRVTITTPSTGARYTRGQHVLADFSCSEGAGGPGLASCLDQHGHDAGTPLDTATVGSHTLTVIARSKDGLSASETVTYRVLPPTRVRIAIPAGFAGVRPAPIGRGCAVEEGIDEHELTAVAADAVCRQLRLTVRGTIMEGGKPAGSASGTIRLSYAVRLPLGRARGSARAAVHHGRWRISLVMPAINLDPLGPSYLLTIDYSGDPTHGKSTTTRRVRLESERAGLNRDLPHR